MIPEHFRGDYHPLQPNQDQPDPDRTETHYSHQPLQDGEDTNRNERPIKDLEAHSTSLPDEGNKTEQLPIPKTDSPEQVEEIREQLKHAQLNDSESSSSDRENESNQEKERRKEVIRLFDRQYGIVNRLLGTSDPLMYVQKTARALSPKQAFSQRRTFHSNNEYADPELVRHEVSQLSQTKEGSIQQEIVVSDPWMVEVRRDMISRDGQLLDSLRKKGMNEDEITEHIEQRVQESSRTKLQEKKYFKDDRIVAGEDKASINTSIMGEKIWEEGDVIQAQMYETSHSIARVLEVSDHLENTNPKPVFEQRIEFHPDGTPRSFSLISRSQEGKVMVSRFGDFTYSEDHKEAVIRVSQRLDALSETTETLIEEQVIAFDEENRPVSVRFFHPDENQVKKGDASSKPYKEIEYEYDANGNLEWRQEKDLIDKTYRTQIFKQGKLQREEFANDNRQISDEMRHDMELEVKKWVYEQPDMAQRVLPYVEHLIIAEMGEAAFQNLSLEEKEAMREQAFLYESNDEELPQEVKLALDRAIRERFVHVDTSPYNKEVIEYEY
jgi:hypothetical protein